MQIAKRKKKDEQEDEVTCENQNHFFIFLMPWR